MGWTYRVFRHKHKDGTGQYAIHEYHILEDGKTTWTKKSDKELELEGANAFGGGELTVTMEAVCKR